MEMIMLVYGFSVRALFEDLLIYSSEKWRPAKIKFSIIRKSTVVPIMQRGAWFPPLVRGGSGALPSGTCSSKPGEVGWVTKRHDQKGLFSRHFSSFLFENNDLTFILKSHLVNNTKYRFLFPEESPLMKSWGSHTVELHLSTICSLETTMVRNFLTCQCSQNGSL